jgi:hypothetical protein
VDLGEAKGLEGIDDFTELADVGLAWRRYDCSDGTGEQSEPQQ